MTIYFPLRIDDNGRRSWVCSKERGQRGHNIIDVASSKKSAWQKAEKLAGEKATYTTIPDWASELTTHVKACYLAK